MYWIVAQLFARILMHLRDPGLCRSQELFVLRDGCLESLSDCLLAADLRLGLDRREDLHSSQSCTTTINLHGSD